MKKYMMGLATLVFMGLFSSAAFADCGNYSPYNPAFRNLNEKQINLRGHTLSEFQSIFGCIAPTSVTYAPNKDGSKDIKWELYDYDWVDILGNQHEIGIVVGDGVISGVEYK